MGLGHSKSLQEAVCCGDIQRVRAVVTAVNVNSTDVEDGWSALHYGAWAGRAEVIKELLLAGADTELEDKAGRTALHFAALGGWSEAVILLCRHGASVDAPDYKGNTPLMYAVGYDHCEAAANLMRWGGGSVLLPLAGQAPPATPATAAHGQSSMHSAQDMPAPSAPPLPSILESGHADEGAWEAHGLLLASGNGSSRRLQDHQQGQVQSVVQYADEQRGTAIQGQGEAEALADALSRLGLRPLQPTPGCRVFRDHVLMSATRWFSQENKMAKGRHQDDPTMSYRGVLPGASPTPIAVRRGLWAHFPEDYADRLAQLRHPNILPLLGVTEWPDTKRVDIVYPLMPNGSLEDALADDGRRARVCDGASPALVQLDWRARTRIAAEVAAALLHLHGLGLTHGRLQPSTVLLGQGLAAKLGDSGLHRHGGMDLACHCRLYAAPEVLEGGCSAEAADVYSFGVLLLELLTGGCLSMIGAESITMHLRTGSVARWLDPLAVKWPLGDANELCQLALRCTATRVESRPNLCAEVLPTISRLAERAEGHTRLAEHAKSHTRHATSCAAIASGDPPAMLICPITQEVMHDPVVLEDGHSYEKEAIQQWLDCGHHTSPMTNLRLAHRQLTPNYTLRSAAREWLAAHGKVGA